MTLCIMLLLDIMYVERSLYSGQLQVYMPCIKSVLLEIKAKGNSTRGRDVTYKTHHYAYLCIICSLFESRYLVKIHCDLNSIR